MSPPPSAPGADGTNAPAGTSSPLFGFLVGIWPLLLGNVVQWYEFGIYGYLVSDLELNFFPGSQVATWLTYAVSFVGRPLGGFLFGWVADRMGRRRATVLSLAGMLVATVGQGLLPSKYCCGEAWGEIGLWALVALRLLQGFCTGGEEAAVLPYIVEAAPKEIKCTASAMFMSTVCLSFLVASGVVFLVTSALDPHQMQVWGWRVPFLLSAIPGAVSLWGRGSLAETPEFLAWQQSERDQDAAALPLEGSGAQSNSASLFLRQCAAHRRALLLLFFGSAGLAVNFYQAMWQVTSLKTRGLLQPAWALATNSLMQVVIIATILGVAVFSDRSLGGRPLPATLLGTALFVLGWLPLYYVIETHATETRVVVPAVALGYGPIIGVGLSTFHLFFVGLFPAEVRGRLFGTVFNVSLAVFGGFAGVISQELGHWMVVGPACYAVAVGAVSFVALLLASRSQVAIQNRAPFANATGTSRDIPC